MTKPPYHEAIDKMHSNQCRRLLVYRGNQFQGILNMRDVAHALSHQGEGKNTLVNLFGGITLLVALGIIGMLIFLLPDMLDLAQRVTNR